MENHYQLTNREFMQQFADCTLPPQWFTHEAHLRLAYCLLQMHTPAIAGRLMSEQIHTFDNTFDDGKKYHRTLTEAAVRVVWHFMQRSPDADFKSLLVRFPRLKTDFKPLLLTHYSTEVLFAPAAVWSYFEPDLLSFDE